MMLFCYGMLDLESANIAKKLKMNMNPWYTPSSMPEANKAIMKMANKKKRKSSLVFTISRKTKPSKRYSKILVCSQFHTLQFQRWTLREKPRLKDSSSQRTNG